MSRPRRPEEILGAVFRAILTSLDMQGNQMSGKHQFCSDGRRIGRVTEQKNGGWAAFDQDDRPLGVFPDEFRAVGAVFVAWKKQPPPGVKLDSASAPCPV